MMVTVFTFCVLYVLVGLLCKFSKHLYLLYESVCPVFLHILVNNNNYDKYSTTYAAQKRRWPKGMKLRTDRSGPGSQTIAKQVS